VYVVLLGLVCLVYAQLLPRKEKAAPSSDMMKELEQSMEMFASDMEEQNESLLQLFADTKRDYESHLAKLGGRMEQLEKQNHQLLDQLSRSPAPTLQPQGVPANASSGDLFAQSEPVATLAAHEVSQRSAESMLPEQDALAGQPVSQSSAPSPLLMNIKERYAELFRLYAQGKSVEQLAKKVGMNKGEVHLIIQLAKQEEKSHV
jgi:hypothetical protein